MSSHSDNNTIIDIVNLNLPALEDFKRKKWTKYFRNAVQHANADLYILPEGLPDPTISGYRIRHGLTDDGPVLLYNVNTISVNPSANSECSYFYTLKDLAVFTGLSVVSTAFPGRVSRSFDLASWGPTTFAEATGLAAYNVVRGLHACMATTQNPVIAVGPMPANNGELKKAVNYACQERDQRYLDDFQRENVICDDSFNSTERVMKPFRDLNKMNVIDGNSGLNASDGVIASRSLKITQPSPINLDHMVRLPRGCQIEDFRPTTTSVMIPSHPPTMLGA